MTASGARQKELVSCEMQHSCNICLKEGKTPFSSCLFFAHTLTQPYCCSYGSCCCSNEPFTYGNDRVAIFTALYAKEVLRESEHFQFVEVVGNLTLCESFPIMSVDSFGYTVTLLTLIKVSHGIVFHA